MAQYDFGISLEEFGRLTPGMFQALQERRQVEIRHHCLYAGIVASTLANLSPAVHDPVSPYDFVGGTTDSERERIQRNVMSLFAMVTNASPEYLRDLRARSIARLEAEGHPDAREIFDEIFTAWKAGPN